MIESKRGNKQALFLFEPNSFVPLATVQDNKTYWYQCDQVGAPQELTDKEGQIVWAADYRVWGEATLRKTGTDGPVRYARQPEPPPVLEQPFRFQGQQFDEETGLHYNRYRYYDPGVGRFVSQDPIGLRGGSNLFAYAPNPFGWVDPFGLAKEKEKGECPSCKEVTNSAGKRVNRKLVKDQDELLSEADRAAGGSLDDYDNYKPDWWKSPDGKRKIEWNPDGHANVNEGPHVTVRDFDGKRHSVTEKIFIEGQETFK